LVDPLLIYLGEAELSHKESFLGLSGVAFGAGTGGNLVDSFDQVAGGIEGVDSLFEGGHPVALARVLLLCVVPSHPANGGLGHLSIDRLATTDPRAARPLPRGTDGRLRVELVERG